MTSLMALFREKHLKVLLTSLKLGFYLVCLFLIIFFSILRSELPLSTSSTIEDTTTNQIICNEGVIDIVNDSNLAFSKLNIQQEDGEKPKFGDRIRRLGLTYYREVVFSRSGRYVAAAGERGDVHLWDMIDETRSWEQDTIHIYGDPWYGTESISFSPDEKFLVSAGQGSSIFLWRVVDGVQVNVTFDHSDEQGYEHILFSSDGLEIIASTQNGSIFIWDTATGEIVSRFPLPGGSELYTSDWPITKSCSRDIALSPNGSFLATGNGHGNVSLWDLNTKTIIKNFTGHTSLVRSLAFTPDGTLLASGSYDGTIRLWNITAGSEHPNSPIFNITQGIISVCFSPDGTKLATGRGNTKYFFDVMSGEELTPITTNLPEEQNRQFFTYSPTGSILASTGDGIGISLWNVVRSPFSSEKLNTYKSSVYSVVFGPNSSIFASAEANTIIKVWNLTTNPKQCIYNFTGHTHTGSGTAVDISPDGSWLVSGSGDKIIRFWNLTSGENKYNLSGHESSVVSVAFSPNGHWLASGDIYGTIKLWNVTDKSTMTIYDNLTGHSSAVIKLKFTPNSDTLASCENSYPSIFLWNLTNRRVMSHFLGHFAKVTSIAFSPDGKQLASGSWDNTVIIWDIEEGKSSVLLTHPSGINTLDFSRNGLLAAGCQDSTIYLWNVTQNLLLSTLSAHDQQVLTVKFSPDNTLLASGGEDNTVILWGIDPLPLDTDFDSIPDSWENQNNLDPLNFSDSLIDLDGDGLMNVMECLLDTKPRVNDSDGDGLHDLWEFLYNSNQTINDASDDSDRDGLPNWFECNYGLNGLIDDTMMDLDGDNLINILELEFDSSPILVDTDYDGMPDGYEFNMSRKVGTRYVGLWPTINDSYSDLDGDEIPNLIEFQLGLNASDETDALGDKDLDDMTNLWEYQMGLDATNDSDAALDLDRDGISNLYEFQMGLNANNDSDAALDLDGDGMSNLYEFQNNLDAMDPNDAVLDKDEDGIPNLYEAQIGLNASDPRDAIEDYDNDTMSNVWEFQMGLNAANPSDADEDSDNDGIINRLESEYGFNATDPTDATLDSDHDGISNRDECIAGTNPRDFWSFPLLSFSVVHRIIGSLILIAAFSVFFILIYQRNQRRKLIAVFKTPDYKTALRVRKTGLSDYPALLQAETKAKEIMEEASAAYYQGNVTEGIQKYEEALESLEQLNSTPLVAHTTFYLAQIYKEQGTLTEDHPIFQRFPKISDDDPVVTVLSHMLQALLAETKNNWGEAEKAWQDAKQVEGLETNLQMICQGGLAESALRTWFYNQNYQNQAQVLTRLDEWEKTAKVDSEKGNLCSVYLLRARLALASYRFSEVEQWLDQCRLTAEEAGMPFYRDLALLERDRLLEHKERVELLFEADKLLSPEDRGKIIQQYIKKAVLTARGARNSVTKTE